MQKTADQSNKHTRETISVTYICIQLPTSNLGNDLVTELLPISAYFYPLQIEQFYANCLVSTSLPISLHIFRYFFIFLDQLRTNYHAIPRQRHTYYTLIAQLLALKNIERQSKTFTENHNILIIFYLQILFIISVFESKCKVVYKYAKH